MTQSGREQGILNNVSVNCREGFKKDKKHGKMYRIISRHILIFLWVKEWPHRQHQTSS
jgi:hypothetical protein